LNLDHGSNVGVHFGENGPDVLVWDGGDWQCLAGGGPSSFQSFECGQAVVNVGRDQSLSGCPTECPSYPADAAVDRSPRQAGLDHGLADKFEVLGTEPFALSAALDAIKHRGPDGGKLWLAADGHVGLGHVRLAIIDRDGSPQPIFNEDGTIVLVSNGEFYGHEEIRKKLQSHGHRFTTGGDSEVAIHLYEEYGSAFLDHLRGEFALVLWDARQRRLLAARDRFGIKPLCFQQGEGRLLLASEAKALFRLGIEPRWDEQCFWQVAGMQYPLADRTLFRDIRQLPPGGLVLADANDTIGRISRYWDMNYPRESGRTSITPRIAADALRSQLEEAVRLRLRSEVPVCFHLSGGLDSSSVVALAQRTLNSPADCFTVGFDGAGYDERREARRTADALRARFHLVELRQEDLLAHLSDAVYFSEGLAINLHLSAKYLLARALRRAGFVVALSGEGSDEILVGYEHLRQDALDARQSSDEQMAALLRCNTLMAGTHLPHGDQLPTTAVERRLGFVPTFLKAKASLGHRLRQVLRDDFVQRFGTSDPIAAFIEAVDLSGQLEGRHPVDQASYLWTRSSLATYIVRTLGDGAEMAHGVEGRVPFLDHHLVEFACSLPVEMKTDGVTSKRLLREVMRELLPAEVCDREKMPFTAPPWTAGRSAPQDSLLDHVHGESLSAQPFFDPAKLHRWIDARRGVGVADYLAGDPVAMLAVTTCMLQDRFRL
jgi:asparagine synthase (glutamine-hydrolysing)